MRIRNTKPEFFRSKRVSERIPDWGNRYLLKALESYVDDNGVGKDDLALIAADCFSQDIALDPSGTFRKLQEGLSALFEAGFLHRYQIDGERLLYISWWESTQYVQKPKAGRHPRPDGTFGYGDSEIGEPDRKRPEASGNVQPVSGNQGIRESGNQLKPPAADADGQSEPPDDAALIPPEPPAPTVTELFTQFWDAYPRKDDKGKALEKFKAALNRAPAEHIIAGAARYRDDPNREAAYTKLPTTWLNADAWDNGPLPPRQGARQSSADARLERAHDIISRRMPGQRPPIQGEITQ